MPNLDCDELQFTKDMQERKARMMRMSDAFVALPGGFGTLEEMSEVITQKQFDFIKGPLVAVNTAGFYDHLAAFFEKFYEQQFAKPAFRATCPFVARPRGGDVLHQRVHAAGVRRASGSHESAAASEETRASPARSARRFPASGC